jgi:trk system potassium uptake protein TrkA
VERGAVSDVEFFEKSNLQMRSLSVAAGSPLAGKSIGALRERLGVHFLVAVIVRDNEYLIPRGDTIVRNNDKLYLIATEDSFERIFATVGKARRKLNKTVFIGGGSVGRLVVEHLLHRPGGRRPLIEQFLRYFSPVSRRKVHVIDSDYRRCRRLSEQFPETLVLNADISEEGFAAEEHFADTDLVVATTENQERNIVNAVYAKTLGAKRTIALVNKTSYVHVASSLGIDVAVSPVDSMVSSILKYIRRGSVRTVHSIPGGKAEVVELSVEPGSRVAGRAIRELRLPRQSLILSVHRQDRDIIPYGDFRFRTGDYLIVITPKESVSRVEEVLSR